MSVDSLGGALFGALVGDAATYSMQVIPALTRNVIGLERAIVGLYVVGVGIALIRGAGGERSKEWLWSIVMVFVFQTTVIESQAFFEWIVDPLMHTTLQLTAWFSDAVTHDRYSGITGMFYRLDQVMGKALAVVDRMEPTGSLVANMWLYVKAGLAMALLFGVYAAVYAAFFGVLAIGVLSLYILFAVAVLPLFFIVFKETRFVGWAWTRAVANYAVMSVLTGVVIGLVISALDKQLTTLMHTDIAQGIFTAEYGAAVLVGVFGLVLLLKTPDLAAALTGGQAGSTAAIAGGLSMAAGAMAGGSHYASRWIAASGPAQWAAGRLGDVQAATMAQIHGGVGRAWSRMRGVSR